MNYHLNYQMSGKYLTRKTTFSFSIVIYVGEDLEFISRVFSWCTPLDHEKPNTKYKKTMYNIKLSNLITVISNYNVCSGIKSEQAKKTAICH